MQRKFPVIACLAVLLVGACKKKEQTTVTTYCPTTGMIRYHNPPVPDVCQLWIVIDSVMYLPNNLGSSFLVDSLKVNLCYTLTGDSNYCGFTSYKYAEINIDSISKQ